MGRRVVRDIQPADHGGHGVWVCGSCERLETACRLHGCGHWEPVWLVLPDPRRMRVIDPGPNPSACSQSIRPTS